MYKEKSGNPAYNENKKWRVPVSVSTNTFLLLA
jgi:hypothetical protein